ncbi:transcriptional antiterminator RfaH [Parvibaculum indicum]|uniref:transcriptional activator RfaH n=1 Tax=Parvibaculum indicum TaxID=562969 RepID=UPI00141E4763|nr:transcriptional activator RfaH [Parvibaculum indicum]NIJ41625.1 transcriptional antiterminator RfaH [Parvibaculum indicum]
MQSQGENWFVAQHKANSARIAERNLRQQGFRSFLPREEKTRRVRGKFVTAPAPLFPGYIFVAFDKKDARWPAINATHGITRLVSFGREPAEVPSPLISELMARCDATGLFQSTAKLQEGDLVRVTKGPFAEMITTIETLESDQRIWILMEVMGGNTRTTIAANALRPA